MPEETKPTGMSKKVMVATSAITALSTLCGSLAGAIAKDGGNIAVIAIGGIVGIVAIAITSIVTQMLIDKK